MINLIKTRSEARVSGLHTKNERNFNECDVTLWFGIRQGRRSAVCCFWNWLYIVLDGEMAGLVIR